MIYNFSYLIYCFIDHKAGSDSFFSVLYDGRQVLFIFVNFFYFKRLRGRVYRCNNVAVFMILNNFSLRTGAAR